MDMLIEVGEELLVAHVGLPSIYRDNLSVVAMEDLAVGDWAVFDAVLGMEEILERRELSVPEHGGVVIKFHVSTRRYMDGVETAGRFIARFPKEPVPRVDMTVA